MTLASYATESFLLDQSEFSFIIGLRTDLTQPNNNDKINRGIDEITTELLD